ncbi:FtsX-like permease family protein [Microbacterium sp.]|uniref:ABC transporter permease n=1 Tax=Microbacterium sp. TaxID=51671 RepID=UPI003A91800B
MGASILVSAISAAFGVILVSATGYLGAMLRADPYIGDSATLAFVLGFLTWVLVGLAVYVAAIVTANTFATVVAGRTPRIALLRLIGASAQSQRAEVARQGLIVGAIGAGVGLVAGVAASFVGIAAIAPATGTTGLAYTVVRPALLLPAAIVALTTWAAAWAGSRRVLAVTPLQAVGSSAEPSREQIGSRRVRHGFAVALFAAGTVLLAGGVLLGLLTPLGVVVAFAGGLVSFTGIVLGAALVMPPLLRLAGRLFGRSAVARLAAENALRHPERSSRMAIGVVVGVTLVTMFAVAMQSAKAVLAAAAGGTLPAEMSATLDGFAGVMMALVAVSGVIAAVGLVNLLTLGVVQRRRELGLLRALGLSTGQVRRIVLLEAAHLTITSVITGVVLGVAYGWAGAQSTLGAVAVKLSAEAAPRAGLVWPAVPLPIIAVIVAATAVLTLVAAVVPTRLATRVTPVAALAA